LLDQPLNKMIIWAEFIRLVKDKFQFLEKCGFQCVSDKQPFVYYDSDVVRIGIFYEINRRRELDVSIEKKEDVGKGLPNYSMSGFRLLAGVTIPDRGVLEFPVSESQVSAELDVLANDIKTYTWAALAGNMKVFDELDELRKKYEKRYQN
jgi:hypothetical protein